MTAALATALEGRAAILDGEIVTLDRRTGAPRFQLLQRRLAVARPRAVLQASVPASLWIFDILHLDGADLTQLPYLQRRAILEDLPLGQSKAIAVPPVWPDLAGDVLLDVMRELSLEGVVMKRADSTYQPGRRSKSWIKSVLRRRAAVVVGGFIPGAAEPVGSLVVGAHNSSGDLVFCGAVSSGLSRKARTALHARLSEIEAPHSPFTDMPSSAGCGGSAKPYRCDRLSRIQRPVPPSRLQRPPARRPDHRAAAPGRITALGRSGRVASTAA